MKTQFQNIFKDPVKAQELWDANSTFFTSLNSDIGDYTDIIELANNNEFINLINWIY